MVYAECVVTGTRPISLRLDSTALLANILSRTLVVSLGRVPGLRGRMRIVLTVVQSRSRLWFAVIGASVLFGLFEFAVSRWFIGVHIAADLHAALQASMVGLGAGFALWLILLGIIDRRRIVADELRRVAELNHTIRNSLEVIVLAHYDEADCERKAIVMECTNRIDQKLRELFPVVGISCSRK
jgi:hypothetical protein